MKNITAAGLIFATLLSVNGYCDTRGEVQTACGIKKVGSNVIEECVTFSTMISKTGANTASARSVCLKKANKNICLEETPNGLIAQFQECIIFVGGGSSCVKRYKTADDEELSEFNIKLKKFGIEGFTK